MIHPGYHGAPGTVSGDTLNYLRSEWPLGLDDDGGAYCSSPTAPDCACDDGACGGDERRCSIDPSEIHLAPRCGPGGLWNSWAHKPKPIPQVPNEPGPPGRFFPVPVRPVFYPSPEFVAERLGPGTVTPRSHGLPANIEDPM